jgi:hypothetical protein
MMTHSIQRPSLHRLAPLTAILLAGCATPHFGVTHRFERWVYFAVIVGLEGSVPDTEW